MSGPTSSQHLARITETLITMAECLAEMNRSIKAIAGRSADPACVEKAE